MTTVYPGDIDIFVRPAGSDNFKGGGSTDAKVIVDSLEDAVEAIETLIGKTGTTDANSILKKLADAIVAIAALVINDHTPEHAMGGTDHQGVAEPAQLPQSYARLTAADISRTSSVALQDVTGVLGAVEASESYRFIAYVNVDGNVSGDIRLAFKVPSGANVEWVGVGLRDNATAVTDPVISQRVTGDDSSAVFGTIAAGTTTTVLIFGRLINSTNAGNLQMRMAQGTSNGTASKVQIGTDLLMWKLT